MNTPEPQRDPEGVNFGPVDGLRALTNLQQQGIAAATEVAERFTAMFDAFARPARNPSEFVNGDGASGAEGNGAGVNGDRPAGDRGIADGDAIGELRSSVARGFDLYSRMFQTTFESWADLVEDRMRDRGITFGASGGDAAVAIGPPGGTAAGELWIHNHTDHEFGPVHLIASPGFAADGASLSPAAFDLTPSTVSVQPATSLRILVTVDLADQTADHTLHALILVQGLPNEALPLQVIMKADEETSTETSPT